MSVLALKPTKLIENVVADSSNKTFTVTAGEEWEFWQLWVKLVTTATAGNRQLTVIIDDGTNEVMRFKAGAVQAASLTRQYVFGIALPKDSAFVDGALLAPLPDRLVLPAGYRVQVLDSAAVDAAADDMDVRAIGLKRYTNT